MPSLTLEQRAVNMHLIYILSRLLSINVFVKLVVSGSTGPDWPHDQWHHRIIGDSCACSAHESGMF
jgi:hypothetical protein